MTTTYDILNQSDNLSLNAIAIAVIDRTKLVEVDSKVVANDGIEVTYRKTTGDGGYPLSVRVGVYPQPNANNGIGQTNYSIKVNTYMEKVTDAVRDWVLPHPMTIAWSTPGVNGMQDKAGVMDLIQTAMCFVLPLASGVFQSTAIDLLSFSVANDLNDITDTGSV